MCTPINPVPEAEPLRFGPFPGEPLEQLPDIYVLFLLRHKQHQLTDAQYRTLLAMLCNWVGIELQNL